jgi:hypothetical protein
MTNIRKDTVITVLDPDIDTPTLTDAWYQGPASKGGFYAVITSEPEAQRFFRETDIVEAPASVVQDLARAAAQRAPSFPPNIIPLKRTPPRAPR